jgi:hypothetical protein
VHGLDWFVSKTGGGIFECGNFLTSARPVRFSERTVFHELDNLLDIRFSEVI